MSVISIPLHIDASIAVEARSIQRAARPSGAPIWRADPASAWQPERPDSVDIELGMFSRLFADRPA
jgi:hypothetical protein